MTDWNKKVGESRFFLETIRASTYGHTHCALYNPRGRCLHSLHECHPIVIKCGSCEYCHVPSILLITLILLTFGNILNSLISLEPCKVYRIAPKKCSYHTLPFDE